MLRSPLRMRGGVMSLTQNGFGGKSDRLAHEKGRKVTQMRDAKNTHPDPREVIVNGQFWLSGGTSGSTGIARIAWNRIELVVDDIEAEVRRLRVAGLKFRNDIVTGPGGSQILLEDPFGNVVELF